MVVLLILLIMGISLTSVSQNNEASSGYSGFDYAKCQYAGNLGVMSAGVGRHWTKTSLEAMYGFTPGSSGGSDVHTFALRGNCDILGFSTAHTHKYATFYLGSGIHCSATQNTYLVYPDYYSDGYYSQNAVHFTGYGGAQLSRDHVGIVSRSISFFLELGTIDYKLIYAIENKSVSFLDIWNNSFGFILRFK